MNTFAADAPARDTAQALSKHKRSSGHHYTGCCPEGEPDWQTCAEVSAEHIDVKVKDMILQIPYQRSVTASALPKLEEVALQAGNARHCSETVTVANCPQAKVERAVDVPFNEVKPEASNPNILLKPSAQ